MQQIQTDPRELETNVCNSTCLYPRQAPRALGYTAKAIIATGKQAIPVRWKEAHFENLKETGLFRI